MNNAIEIKDLIKKYDDKFTLKVPKLTITKGTIVGLIGENGAGKTTLIKCLLGIINKYEGQIKIFSKEEKEEYLAKEDIGVVLDNMFFPDILKPKDISIIMHDIYKTWDKNLFYNYLQKFNISPQTQIKKLSTGTKKKLEIATALSHKPKLLILDEPTSGLDPVVRREILDLFLEYMQNPENTILLSTHITTDLEHIADYIIFINKGNIILNATRDEILDNYGILKCGEQEFNTIAKEDIISYQKNRYDYQILVKDKKNMQKKYKNFIIDNITLEDLMVLKIKGANNERIN